MAEARITDVLQQWERWAQHQFAGSDRQVRAAADAAVLAALRGASGEEAAAAGLAAGRAAAAPTSAEPASNNPARPSSSASLGDSAPQAVLGGRGIVGRAQRVQRHQQLTGSTPIQTLEFQVVTSDSSTVHVQMRGVFLEGSLSEGDVIEITGERKRGGLIQTDRAYNRTTGSSIIMRKGISGAYATTKAQLGRGLTHLQILVISIVGLLVLGFLAWLFYSIITTDMPSWDGTVPQDDVAPPDWWEGPGGGGGLEFPQDPGPGEEIEELEPPVEPGLSEEMEEPDPPDTSE